MNDYKRIEDIVTSDLDTVRAALMKDRKDAARLDWLEKNERSLNLVTIQRRKPRTDGNGPYESYLDVLGWSADLSDPNEYATVREAIDTAMRTAEPKSPQ